MSQRLLVSAVNVFGTIMVVGGVTSAWAQRPSSAVFESLSAVANVTTALMRNGQVGRLDGVPQGVAQLTRTLVDSVKTTETGCTLNLPTSSRPVPTGPDQERTDLEMSVTGPGCPFAVILSGYFLRDGTKLTVDLKWDYISQHPDVKRDTGLEAMSMRLSGGGHLLQPDGASVDVYLEIKGETLGRSVSEGDFELSTQNITSQFFDFSGTRPNRAREYEKLSLKMAAGSEELFKEIVAEGGQQTRVHRYNGQDIEPAKYEEVAAGFRLPMGSDDSDEPLPVPMTCEVGFYRATDLSVADAQKLLNRGQAVAVAPVHTEKACLDVGTRESRHHLSDPITTDIFASNQEMIFTTTRKGVRSEYFTAPGLPGHHAESLADLTVTYQCRIVPACPQRP
jgi:hypothetical protein